MSDLPASGVLGDLDPAHLSDEFAAELEAMRDVVAESPGATASTTLTIASGAIVPPAGAGGGWHLVDTEGAAASDDLTSATLTNSQVGRRLVLAAVNASRVVTVKHAGGGSGQYLMYDDADFVLDALDKWIEFRLVATDWVEVKRCYGVDRAGARLGIGVPKQISHNTLCPHRNLVGAWASNSTVTFTADELVLEDASGNQMLVASYNKTATITVSGAAGLDTGAEASSTWYHVWAIAKSDGTQSILLSTSETLGGLTFSAGYTYAGYIGAVRNNGSSNFNDFRQAGARVAITAAQVLTSGAATTDTALSSGNMENAVPTTAKNGFGYARVSDSTSGGSSLALNPVNGSTVGKISISNPGGNTGQIGTYFELPFVTAQVWYYSVTTSDNAVVVITGFEF